MNTLILNSIHKLKRLSIKQMHLQWSLNESWKLCHISLQGSCYPTQPTQIPKNHAGRAMVVVGFPWPAHNFKAPLGFPKNDSFTPDVWSDGVPKSCQTWPPETSGSARMTSALVNWLACWGYAYSYMDWHPCNKQPLACSCLQLWSIQACRVWAATTWLGPATSQEVLFIPWSNLIWQKNTN